MDHIRKFNENENGLKIKVKTLNVVDCDDLERYIRRIYGVVYEIVAEQEWNNDSNYKFSVDGVIPNYDMNKVERIRNGNNPGQYSLHIFLNLLALDGHISRGDYLIEVSW